MPPAPRRVLQKYVEDELAEELLKGNLGIGAKVEARLNAEKSKLIFNITEGIKQIDEKNLESPKINTEEVLPSESILPAEYNMPEN